MYFKQKFSKEERKRIEREKRTVLEEMSVTEIGSPRYLQLIDTYKALNSMIPEKHPAIGARDAIEFGLKGLSTAAAVLGPYLMLRSEHKFETGGYTLSSSTARNSINEVYNIPRNLNK